MGPPCVGPAACHAMQAWLHGPRQGCTAQSTVENTVTRYDTKHGNYLEHGFAVKAPQTCMSTHNNTVASTRVHHSTITSVLPVAPPYLHEHWP
jgi:hypothetical protein